ncbi:MAG: type III-B CRISPR module RAMP protein Cmr4 [Thermoprotei archaeon]|nr:MAG: type III-B CRISPR module RAMP protein Cmr4 [Thermoprotei archaeon]
MVGISLTLLRTPPTYYDADLVLINALTNLHVGVGRSGGIVDLPVQRDELGYPCIYSSSIKGALKTTLLQAFTRLNHERAYTVVKALLGPEPEEGETFESSIAILDAYLIAMPVRSLKGVYAYVTAPILLDRFWERLELLKGVRGSLNLLGKLERPPLLDIGEEEALCMGGNCKDLIVEELSDESVKRVVLGEHVLKLTEPDVDEQEKFKPFFDILGLEKPLLMVNDNTAKEIVERGLVRVTRVRLRRETKTVDTGGLWTEEYMPMRTRLHTLILYKRPSLTRSFIKGILGEQGDVGDREYLEALKKLGLIEDSDVSVIQSQLDERRVVEASKALAKAIKERVHSVLKESHKNYIIIGGNETIGKGIVKLNLVRR